MAALPKFELPLIPKSGFKDQSGYTVGALLPSHIDIGEVDFSCLVHYGTARNQVALFGESVTSITAVEIKGFGCL